MNVYNSLKKKPSQINNMTTYSPIATKKEDIE